MDKLHGANVQPGATRRRAARHFQSQFHNIPIYPLLAAALAVLGSAQLFFTFAPAMNAIFDTRPLHLTDGLLIVGAGVFVVLFLEAEKALMGKLGWFEELSPEAAHGREMS